MRSKAWGRVLWGLLNRVADGGYIEARQGPRQWIWGHLNRVADVVVMQQRRVKHQAAQGQHQAGLTQKRGEGVGQGERCG